MIIPLQLRFPRPEFTVDYTPAVNSLPSSPVWLFLYLDIAVMILLLVLTSLAVYKWKNRKILLGIAVTSLIYFGLYRQACPCPIGLLPDMASFAVDRSLSLPLPYFLIFLIPLLTTITQGRTYCAGVCPLGAVQELLFLKKIRLPKVVTASLSVIPVLYLGLVIAGAATGSSNLVCRIDPFQPVFHLGSLGPGRTIITVAVLAVCTIIYRPYCRFLCPYGLLLRGVSRISGKKPEITNNCINCRLCESTCPADAVNPREEGNLPDKKEKKRLIILLAALPVLVTLSSWGGSKLGDVFSSLHRDIRLERLLDSGDQVSEEVTAAAANRTDIPALEQNNRIIEKRFRIIMTISGGAAALSAFFVMLRSLRKKPRKNPEPDAADCFFCGRCLPACPVNKSNRSSITWKKPFAS